MKKKFIHVSDIHTGFTTHGRINPATKLNTRLEDVMRSLDFVVDTAIAREVDAVLVTGDTFHRSHPSPAEQNELAKRLERLSRADIETVIITGNHDFTLDGSGVSALEVVNSLGVPRIHVIRRPVALEVRGMKIACLPWVGGAGLVAREEFKNLTPQQKKAEIERRLVSIVRNMADGTAPGEPCVFMGHFAVSGSELSGTEYTSLSDIEPHIPLHALADTRFHYVALGHIHQHQDLNRGAQPPVVYAGSIERIDFTEEGDRKGFVYGELENRDGEWTCEFEFVETPARKFVTVNLPETGVPEEPDPETEGAIVRVRMDISTADQEIDEAAVKSAYGEAFSVALEKKYLYYKDNKRAVRAEGVLKGMSPATALKVYIEQHPELEPLREELEARISDIIGQKEAA